MNAIRRSIGTIFILGAAAGCAGEPESPPPPVSNPTPAPKQSQPPSPKILKRAPDAGESKEMTPAAAPATTKPDAAKKGDDTPKVEAPKTSDNAKPDAKATNLSAKELAGINKLPASEQDAAIAQAVCPVSTHKLGGMGKPIKVSAEGRTVYLCCDGCEEDFKADPKKFLAKLDKPKDAK